MSSTDDRDSEKEPDYKTPPAPLDRPHDAPVEAVLRRVWDRLNRKNEHFVMATVGREGSGKSHTSMKIADVLDDGFTHEHVFFQAADFLELLRDRRHRPGAVYVLDEAGVSFGRRTWQDRAQVLANQALQLIRDHNVGLIFTLPRISELDTQTEGRLQAFYEITKKNPGEWVEGKWKWIDPDRTGATGTIYKKYPRDDRGNRVTRLKFAPPREELVEPYEARKTAFQEAMYEEAIGALRDDDDEDELDAEAIADEIREDGLDGYVREINNGAQRVFDRKAVEREYGIGKARSKRVKNALTDELPDDVM